MKNPVIDFWLHYDQWFEVVIIFSRRPRNIFCPLSLSWLLVGLVWTRLGLLENEHWLQFSQLKKKRLTLLKNSTSASGLGQRRGGGALYYISKVQTQTWVFLAWIHEAPAPQQTSHDSFLIMASFLVSTRISHKTGRRMERSAGHYREPGMDVMMGKS